MGICLNILCNCCNLHTNKTLYLFNIYFYIMSALVWKGGGLINNALIYFITDLFNDKVSNKLTNFTVFHHTSTIILFLIYKLTNYINIKLIELCMIFEISSIPLVLFYMGYIPKPVYNIVFSYSFIFVRLIYFNYTAYNMYLDDYIMFNNQIIGIYIFLNTMNVGIAWKMKLVQKLFAIRPVIDLFSNKRAIK